MALPVCPRGTLNQGTETMLWNASAIKGYTIEALDGEIGTVADLLFDDRTWTTRWLVVKTGNWFLRHQVLLPLSALGKPDAKLQKFSVQLTRQQVKDSPDADTDRPISRHIETNVFNHYGWNPYWTSGFALESNAIATPLVLPLLSGTDAVPEDGDPDLRSTDAIIGYHIAATDGEIGHVDDLLVDDADWRLRYITVDTKNWLQGQRVLLSPCQIKEIDWSDKMIRVDVDREKIKSAPLYDPQTTGDGPYNDRFHAYFGLTIPDGDELRN
jgi:uncharacterized protein YrrD